MAISSFEELCKGLCEVAGVTAPDMTPDPHGGIAVELEMTGVRVILAHDLKNQPDQALILAIFGPLPAGRELEACRALLNLNCQVHSLGYAFGRNPATGDIVLKQRCPLGETSSVDLYQRLVEMVQGIRGWRDHHFMADAADPAASVGEASS